MKPEDVKECAAGVSRVLIAGGIGAGKSVVSRILRLEGHVVYDCDLRARELMDGSDEFKKSLAVHLGSAMVTPTGDIDRRALAARVFSDQEALQWLNHKVHAMVREDILSRSEKNLFIESAIPASSGLLGLATAVWWVDAPEPLRINRVMSRSGLSRDEALARIEAQRSEYRETMDCGLPVVVIDNDGDTPLLDVVCSLVGHDKNQLQDLL